MVLKSLQILFSSVYKGYSNRFFKFEILMSSYTSISISIYFDTTLISNDFAMLTHMFTLESWLLYG